MITLLFLKEKAVSGKLPGAGSCRWETGFLLDTPAGKVEFFTNAQEDLPKGTIRHFAFEVDDVDAYINLCQDNGHEIFMGPKDVVLGDIKARVAFTYGPLREEVEFFELKN